MQQLKPEPREFQVTLAEAPLLELFLMWRNFCEKEFVLMKDLEILNV